MIEIRDPEIDVDAIMQKIRHNASLHSEAAPSGHESILAEERMGLRSALESVRRSMSRYGEVASQRRGVKRRMEVAVKKAARKVVRRHLDQGGEVHQEILRFFSKLVPYLDQQARNYAELDRRLQAIEQELSHTQSKKSP